jgi:IS5 family transposase
MAKRGAIKVDLFASDRRREKLDEIGDPLVMLERHVDFTRLAAEVDRVAPRPVAENGGGRPPYPTETLVRILVLKRLHNLADEQMEYQLLDRMSFQRFCGLEDSASIPDRNTIWGFENRIGVKAARALFAEVQRQMARRGFVARCGQIIDATLVPAPKQHFTREERERLERGEVPQEWSAAKRRQKDLDASWTKKHGESHFGYKLSINADKKHKLIREFEPDTAKVHDSQHFDAVVDPKNSSADVYGDKGYASAQRETELNRLLKNPFFSNLGCGRGNRSPFFEHASA